MNVQIQALMAQAGTDTSGKWMSVDNAERFAELIAEEMYCFMVDATSNDEPWPSFEQIKKHFGVDA